MSILSFAATKDYLYYVNATKTAGQLMIHEKNRIAVTKDDWVHFEEALNSVVDAISAKDKRVRFVIVAAATGMYQADADTFKAEGILELLLAKHGISFSRVTRNSLPKALRCSRGVKWQDQAKAMFNADKSITYFSSGYDAVCAGVYALE